MRVGADQLDQPGGPLLRRRGRAHAEPTVRGGLRGTAVRRVGECRVTGFECQLPRQPAHWRRRPPGSSLCERRTDLVRGRREPHHTVDAGGHTTTRRHTPARVRPRWPSPTRAAPHPGQRSRRQRPLVQAEALRPELVASQQVLTPTTACRWPGRHRRGFGCAAPSGSTPRSTAQLVE